MEKETDFYTATMAKVYADQEHWEKAAEIYRHLLKQEPDRIDFLEALAEAETKIISSGKKTPDKLAPLFHQFFDLMLKVKNIQKLRKLRSRG
jgi:cytochrome c-type biogenesis protein CcmH/NrfG